MTIPKMSKAVARELAISFKGAVIDFIKINKDAYLRYLAATGQQSLDPYYANQITEATDK